MSAEWKVGVSDSRALAVWDGEQWSWAANGRRCLKQPPTNLRPLVLIDPEDEEQVKRLLSLYYGATGFGTRQTFEMQAALREYASPTPPKPDEPMGLGAVVVDADGIKWVRADVDAHPWTCGGYEWRNYADISAVEKLSDGVES